MRSLPMLRDLAGEAKSREALATVAICSDGNDVDATRSVARVAVVATLTDRHALGCDARESSSRARWLGNGNSRLGSIFVGTVFCSNSSISTVVDLYARKSGGYCDRSHTLAACMNS